MIIRKFLMIIRKNQRQQEKNLVTYKKCLMKLTADFSPETMEARRQWDDTFKDLRERKKLSTKNTTAGKTILFK